LTQPLYESNIVFSNLINPNLYPRIFTLLVSKGYSIKDVNIVSEMNKLDLKDYENLNDKKLNIELNWKSKGLSSVSLMLKVLGPELRKFNDDLIEEFKEFIVQWGVDTLCFYEG
jgi:ribosomal protein S8